MLTQRVRVAVRLYLMTMGRLLLAGATLPLWQMLLLLPGPASTASAKHYRILFNPEARHLRAVPSGFSKVHCIRLKTDPGIRARYHYTRHKKKDVTFTVNTYPPCERIGYRILTEPKPA